jgi:hypothetical protein
MKIMDKKLKLENRIALLESRPKKENGKIIAKLQRKLRNLDK